MIHFVGIDPGVTGAIAHVRNANDASVFDFPTLKVGNRSECDGHALCRLMEQFTQFKDVRTAVEKAQPHPRDGRVGSFKYGKVCGAVEIALHAYGLPFELVRPQVWKKIMMSGHAKDKDASIYVAKQLFPCCADVLSTKNSHNRAEALLMAEYMRRKTYGPRPKRKRRRLRKNLRAYK